MAEARGDFLSVELRPSVWQFCGWLLLHVVIFAVLIVARLPVDLHLGLCLLLIGSMISIGIAWRQLRGPFAVRALICDATHQWHVQYWHEKHLKLITLYAYRATPFGMALIWVPLGHIAGLSRKLGLLYKFRLPSLSVLLKPRLRMFITRDQLSEADYRWLKVLISQASPLSSPKTRPAE
jgi:hypothetical protein